MITDKVVEQKPIATTEIWDFEKKLKEAMDEGWRIVPGTIVITLSLGPSKLNERYFAVLEK